MSERDLERLRKFSITTESDSENNSGDDDSENNSDDNDDSDDNDFDKDMNIEDGDTGATLTSAT